LRVGWAGRKPDLSGVEVLNPVLFAAHLAAWVGDIFTAATAWRRQYWNVNGGALASSCAAVTLTRRPAYARYILRRA